MQPSEVTLSGFPASASAEPLPVQSLAQLVAVLELQRHQPVISLRQALEQLDYIDAATLDRIQAETPEQLRNQSGELVRRMLLTADDLEHALARMGGIPEVDTVRFSVPPEAFQVLRVREARLNEVVPLGAVFDWARPQSLPVTVVPGAGHFFHGQLTLLKHIVTGAWHPRTFS